MSLTFPKVSSFGGSKTGLVGTIGVTLLNPDGSVYIARATAGIYEIGGGCYGKNITFPDNWKGSIMWDTGGASPVYAVEDYNDYDTTLSGIQADLDTPDQYKADVSAVALEATVGALPSASEIDTELTSSHGDGSWQTGTSASGEYDDRLAAIQADLDTPDQYKADVSAVALEATVTQYDSYKADVSELSSSLIRILGLVQENFYLDSMQYTEYDGGKLLNSGRLRIYSSAGSVGTDSDVIATYIITSAWDGDELQTYKVVKQ